MRISFKDSLYHSAHEIAFLRNSVERKDVFDKAVESMVKEKFIADTDKGTTRNVNGVVGQFINYDWANEYEHLNLVFYDFFRPHLMNKYFRMLRGLDL